MSDQQNLDLVRRGYAAFGRGDINGLLELFAEDIVWTTPGPAGFPTAGTRRGRAQVGEFFQRLDETFAISRFEPKTFLASGEHVVVLGEDTASVKATGKTIDNAWAHVFTIRNGKVAGFQEYMDVSASVLELQAAGARA
jgi:ketosteroid isomerase-like protein